MVKQTLKDKLYILTSHFHDPQDNECFYFLASDKFVFEKLKSVLVKNLYININNSEYKNLKVIEDINKITNVSISEVLLQ